jgi:hypothetical protein
MQVFCAQDCQSGNIFGATFGHVCVHSDTEKVGFEMEDRVEQATEYVAMPNAMLYQKAQ